MSEQELAARRAEVIRLRAEVARLRAEIRRLKAAEVITPRCPRCGREPR